ncbi:MAG TPA: hypothetical protein VKE51_01170 [Vicinamibacterales bacterium]|nr:hypothetical protein [Vicinamibacterales bacterium]
MVPMPVIGRSGLTDRDYAEIDRVATRVERGVLAVGNFALTVVLMQKCAEMAAKWIPQWEIIDSRRMAKSTPPAAPRASSRPVWRG